jgi:hypothetical protein
MDDEKSDALCLSSSLKASHRDAGAHIEGLQEVDDPSFHPLRR